MNWDTATKQQLLQIALNENCPLSFKYEAIRELQLNKWTDEMLTDLVRLWGKGFDSFSIAIELGIDQDKVKRKLTQYGLWKRRVNNELRKII